MPASEGGTMSEGKSDVKPVSFKGIFALAVFMFVLCVMVPVIVTLVSSPK